MKEYGYTAYELGQTDIPDNSFIMDNLFLIPVILIVVIVLFLIINGVVQGNRIANNMLTEITITKRTVVFYGLCGIRCERLTICRFQLDEYTSEGWSIA